jgi:hypothetical protein
MRPLAAHNHCCADNPVPRYAVFIFICCFTLQYIFPTTSKAQPISEEPQIVIALKETTETFGYMIDVQVIYNRYTGMQDLFVTPAREQSYDTESFISNVCAAAAGVTAQNLDYQTYDVLMINVNEELWAISIKSCRQAFSMATEAEQHAMLKGRLQQLK